MEKSKRGGQKFSHPEPVWLVPWRRSMSMEFNNFSCFSLELLIGGLVGKEMRGRGTRQTSVALEGRGEVPGTDEEDSVQDSAQSESL